MLEHLDREEARKFLAEARRLLASGGILRLAVPDIRMLVEKYLATGDSDAFIEKTLLSETKPKGVFAKLMYALFTGFRHHHWMYDSVSLPKLLIEAGFRDRSSYRPVKRQFPIPDCSISGSGGMKACMSKHEIPRLPEDFKLYHYRLPCHLSDPVDCPAPQTGQ
jgi:predicted SAM-dependent methyltransferase